MNTLIQVVITTTDHPGFPLLAEGVLHLPGRLLPIIEYGRSRSEIFERVFAFAQFHASYSAA